MELELMLFLAMATKGVATAPRRYPLKDMGIDALGALEIQSVLESDVIEVGIDVITIAVDCIESISSLFDNSLSFNPFILFDFISNLLVSSKEIKRKI
jgi:hypothetical protein